MAVAILNFTDFHDAFCVACGNAGLIREYLELLEQLKKCTPEFEVHTTSLTSAEDKDSNFSRKGSLIFEVLGVLHNLS